MRPFRFPRSMIVLMVLILAGTLFAIDKGRNIQQAHIGDSNFEIAVPGLYGFFGFSITLMFCIGAIGYGVLCAMHQSGAQRFPSIRTWTERRRPGKTERMNAILVLLIGTFLQAAPQFDVASCVRPAA